MTLNRINIAVPFIATAITLLAIVVLVKLGFWQLDRAHQKQQLFADFEHASQQQPERLTSLEQPQRYQSVAVSGHFDPTHYLLLDNQIFKSQVGYQVIGVFTPDVGNQKLLVNLGWVAAPASRQQLPQVTIPSQQMQISGYAYSPSDNVFAKQVIQFAGKPWPQRIQKLDIPSLQKQLQQPLAAWVLLLDQQYPWAWPREWRPQVMPASRHQAYALQWFSLAAACAIIYILALRKYYFKKQQEGSE